MMKNSDTLSGTDVAQFGTSMDIGKNTPVSSANLGIPSKSSIGSMLLDMDKLTPDDIELILRLQKEQGIRFGEAALRLGLITEADIRQVVAKQFDYPYLQPGQENYPSELVAAYDPFSPQVEVLRAIRSQLMLRWIASGHKAFAVASVNSGDGTSLFAANLAVVFSQLGERTLLIDANLRAPRQKEIFNLSGGYGLSDILARRVGLEFISRVRPFADLFVLQAGTPAPNPQELVSRASFGDLNETLTSGFDVVLYDTPAFSTGTDVLAIASRVGGVLVVARKDSTNLAALNEVNEKFVRYGVEVIGSVLVEF